MSFENQYGKLDRLLHRLAFASPSAQLGMADLEERMFKQELAAVEPGPPLFVTSLPRAGTTILLEILAALPEFATHNYRQMPFVLCPMLWDKLTARFRRKDTPRERAHGDGIEISLDSPEAFEEMLWKQFWPKHYLDDRIEPWADCRQPEFEEFFAAHRRKIIALKRRSEPRAQRYLSKNNLNIARLPALLEQLPDSLMLLPLREPLQHAASLLRQHLRFGELHRDDAFARRYMEAIGHFDFGANLKPVDFDHWYPTREHRDPDQLAFWLEYWEVAFRRVLEQAEHPRLRLLSFEGLGQATDLTPLADSLGLADAGELNAQVGRLKPARSHQPALDGVPDQLVARVGDLHRRLLEHCLL